MRNLIFVFIGFTFLSFINNENEILWSSDYKLKWEDFKGTSPKNIEDLTTAIIYCKLILDIESEEGKLPKFKVFNYFLKDSSWTIVYDDKSLKHEQLHFDIYEIFARKIRKSLDSLNKKKVYDEEIYINKYKELGQKCSEYSNVYDNNVYFSDENQKKWNEKIEKELEELKEYQLLE